LTVDLANLLRATPGKRCVVAGDAILDVYVRGTPRGLCREAPAPVVSVQATDAVPGGAANAATNLAGLGGRAGLLSVVGDDDAGRDLRAALHQQGVDTEALVVDPGRATLVKRRIVVGNHILLRLDEGTTGPVGEAAALTAQRHLARLCQSVDVLLVSDYGYGVLSAAMVSDLADIRAAIRVVVVDAADAAAYTTLRPTAVTPDYAQAVRLLGLPALDEEADRIAQIRDRGAHLLRCTSADLAVVTLGPGGAMLFERERAPFHSRARNRIEHDVLGAGDVFAAALGLALSAEADPPLAVELATLAAVTALPNPTGTATCTRDAIMGRLQATDKVLDPSQVADWASTAHTRGQRIVFTNGCFDLVHEGHVTFLNQAKALGDVLIVGVNDDESVRHLKGPGRPVVDLSGRLRLLAALSCVDHVVPFSGPTPLPLMEKIRPQVFVKGGDYLLATLAEADGAREIGAEVRILDYVADRSTTSLIERARSVS
jgi:D-beta-D-heptose 7-phosphate kinase / D-beta-D-heptose 1-phosphate adenosyltransferase